MSELLVTIPVAEYTALVTEATKAKIIEDGIMSGAKLSYSGDKLVFDDDVVSTIMRSVLPATYEGIYLTLKGLKEGTS